MRLIVVKEKNVFVTVCRGGRLFIIIFQGLFYYFIILGFTKCYVEECHIVECVL